MKLLLGADLFILIAVGLSFSNSQVLFPGACPKLSVVQPFDVERYLGVWYEVEKYPARFEGDGKCVYAVYSAGENGTIQVRNTRIQPETGEYSEIVGTARQTEPEAENGKLAVQFPNAPEGAYWVLSTDYDSYSIVWSCTDAGSQNAQFFWFLSRFRQPSRETRELVRYLMQQLNLDMTNLKETDQDQTSCPNPYAIV